MCICTCVHNYITFFYGALPQTEKMSGTSVKIISNEMKGDVGMLLHEKEGNKKNLHQADNPSLHLCS